MTEMTGTRRFHFSVWALLTLQFAIAPLFLAGPYADYNSRAYQFDPIRALVWFVVPPLVYVLLLVAIKLRVSRPRSFVFSGIRRGILFGILFGVLSWGPSGVPAIVQDVGDFRDVLGSCLRNGFPPMSFRVVFEAAEETLGESGRIFGFWLVNYAVLGSASGGITGVVMQWVLSTSNASSGESV